MSKWVLILLALLAPVPVSLAIADAAGATTGFARLGAFAEAPTDGLLSHNRRIAVNWGTGDIYKTDTLNNRVVVYRPNGSGADELTTFATGGAVSEPLGIAIDQDNGDVYVSDVDDIVKYDSDGAATPTFTLDAGFTSPGVTGPIAFDQAANELVVADRGANEIKRFSTAGAATGIPFDGNNGASTTFTGLQDLAVDSTGDIIVIDATPGGDPALGSGTTRVERFTSAGVHEATIGPVAGAATVTTIPATDDVVISGNQDAVMRDELPTVSLFDSSGTPTGQVSLDQSLQFATIFGLAADDGMPGRFYIASDVDRAYNGGGTYGHIGIEAYGTFLIATARPPVALDPVSGLTAESATLHGHVDPLGFQASYRFEYRKAGTATWTRSPDPDADAGTGNGDVAVQADLTGLIPAQKYEYRLVATNNLGVTESSIQTLTTPGLAPTVADVRATGVRGTSTQLTGTVNPRHQVTSYHFEYGPTTSYGTSTPTADAGIGTEGRSVEASVSGLQPGTTYHVRLVATNATGTTTSADQAFVTGAAGPDRDTSRGYELVSPREKAGTLLMTYKTVQSAADGNAVAFAATGPLVDAQAGVWGGYYVSRRTGDGWSTHGVEAPQSSNDGQVASPTWFFDDDLLKAFQFSGRELAPGGIEGGGNLYLRDNLTGARTLVASTTNRSLKNFYATLTGTRTTRVAATQDLSHVVFQSDAQLLPGAVVSDDPDLFATNIYEWFNGRLRLVNVLPDGTVAQATMGSTAFSERPMSADGSKVFFAAGGTVYVRINGTTTVPLAISRRSGDPSTPTPAKFQAASEDGNIVYFTSPTALTDDANSSLFGDLYKYDFRTSALTDVTATAPENVVIGTASVRDVSVDGRYVYFGSWDKLTDDAELYGSNFYVAHDDVVKRVAGSPGSGFEGPTRMSLSPNGRFAAFASISRLTEDGNTDPTCKFSIIYGNADGACVETYIYDAQADTLVCPGCNPVDGQRRFAELPAQTYPTSVSVYRPQVVRDDGHVFFHTAARLVEADTNGKVDVYEWDGQKPVLISTGQGNGDATLADVSADGRDVFFFTDQRLVAADADSAVDLYDARVGGGLASQAASPPGVAPCAADNCQGSPTSKPRPVAAGSVSFAGSGNADPSRTQSVRAKVRASVPKSVKGTALKIAVKAPAGGRISVSGSDVVGVSRKVGRAGSYSVRVVLSQKAKRALKRSRAKRLKTAIRVRYAPTSGSASSTVLTVNFKA